MEKFTVSYKVIWGMPSGGKEVKYNSDKKELYAKEHQKPATTRILTSEEETDLKKKILETGYLDSKQEPKDDNNTTEGTSTDIEITIGDKSRSVHWYYGVGGNPTVPIEIKNVEEIINRIAFPK
jgi:hypothetical protein